LVATEGCRLVAVIIAGLLPITWGSGTGLEIVRRIACPMVGGDDHGAALVDVRGAGDLPADAAATTREPFHPNLKGATHASHGRGW
jgi:hypothetical protein